MRQVNQRLLDAPHIFQREAPVRAHQRPKVSQSVCHNPWLFGHKGINVTHEQVAKGSIKWFATLQAEVTRLADGSPPAALAERKHHMVQQPRRVPMLFQDGGRYERRFEAMGRCVPERAAKTSQSFAVLFAIIGEGPNKFLCLARCPPRRMFAKQLVYIGAIEQPLAL